MNGGPDDGRFEVVDDQRLRHAAEVRETVLQAAEEVFRRLRERRFAIGLAAVAQDDAEDVCFAAFPLGRQYQRAAAEIDLSFFARSALHPSERERRFRHESPHVPLHAVIAAAEAPLGHQVLPDPLGRKLPVELGQDDLAQGLALSRPATRKSRTGLPSLGKLFARRPGGQNGCI
jgi:hypothetical protein